VTLLSWLIVTSSSEIDWKNSVSRSSMLKKVVVLRVVGRASRGRRVVPAWSPRCSARCVADLADRVVPA
jgi:hypothetical protein